jgi:hypothetical protein
MRELREIREIKHLGNSPGIATKDRKEHKGSFLTAIPRISRMGAKLAEGLKMRLATLIARSVWSVIGHVERGKDFKEQ